MACASPWPGPIHFEPSLDAPSPPVHFMVESGEGWDSGHKVSSLGFAASLDYFGMIFHGYTVTHVDSLAHFFWNNKTYNGKPAHLVSTSQGATFGSVEEAKEGIITRAVLVDVPMIRGIDWTERGEGRHDRRHPRRRGTLRLPGRGGRRVARPHRPAPPGATWRARLPGKRVRPPARPRACPCSTSGESACWAATPATMSSPPQYENVPSPIHQVGITAMGLWVLDNANLEEVAAACRERNRWEFLISIGPLRLHNTTGSPVNPIAIF